MHIIYCAVCIAYGHRLINKKYIGQSRYTFADRSGEYVYPTERSPAADQYTLAKVQERHFEIARIGDQRHFYNALRRYKRNQFCWGIIDTAENQEEADRKKEYHIRAQRSADRNYGYNISLGDEDIQPHPQGTISL